MSNSRYSVVASSVGLIVALAALAIALSRGQEDTIEVETIRLVDPNGTLRGLIKARPGVASLQFLRHDGTSSVVLQTDDLGASVLVLDGRHDNGGELKVWAYDGDAGVRMKGGGNRRTIECSVDELGRGGISSSAEGGEQVPHMRWPE